MAARFVLEPVLRLAQEALDAATRRLGELEQKLQAEEHKLAQLEVFRAEYRERLQSALAQGLEAPRLKDFQGFLGRLELAIRRQKEIVAEAEQRREEAHRQWLEARRRLKTFEVLRTRHERAEAREAARREQREQDEHARRRP